MDGEPVKRLLIVLATCLALASSAVVPVGDQPGGYVPAGHGMCEAEGIVNTAGVLLVKNGSLMPCLRLYK